MAIAGQRVRQDYFLISADELGGADLLPLRAGGFTTTFIGLGAALFGFSKVA